MSIKPASKRRRAQRASAYVDQLPAQQRGAVILALMANAILTLALQAAWLVLGARAVKRMRRPGEEPSQALAATARSGAIRAVAGATIAHQLARIILARALDGRARRAMTPQDTATDSR